MVPERLNPPGDGPPAVATLRERLEAVGQISAELLHDLSEAAHAVEQRARLAAGEARLGRPVADELERAVEASADMRAMLRDVVDVLRGAALSPEVGMDPRAVVERAIRRFVVRARQLEIRLVSDVPEGTMVPGRESFLARLVANLLAGAARRARGAVCVELRVDPPDAEHPRAGVLLSVEDDGPPGRHPHPSREDEWRPAIVGWLIVQLGAEVSARAATRLGGCCLEIRLPARLP
ncbi:MAG TPA: hypothetical protein VFQ45_16485 [Longimicrobium sp.]|nr:hypothetical protein [Longimicrobium sp.]